MDQNDHMFITNTATASRSKKYLDHHPRHKRTKQMTDESWRIAFDVYNSGRQNWYNSVDSFKAGYNAALKSQENLQQDYDECRRQCLAAQQHALKLMKDKPVEVVTEAKIETCLNQIISEIIRQSNGFHQESVVKVIVEFMKLSKNGLKITDSPTPPDHKLVADAHRGNMNGDDHGN